MSDFLKKLGLFSLLCFVISILVLIGYKAMYKISADDIPAPPISDSYSLNEKVEFLRKARKDVSVFALGSSIALNNFHTQTARKLLKSDAFLNAASWGMNMQDSYLFLKVLQEIYHPDTVILIGSVPDFERADKQTDYSLMKKYILSEDFMAGWYYLKCFNLRYYLDNTKYKKHVRSDAHTYEYLIFDPHGGINLDGTDFKIDQKRWEESFDHMLIDSLNYQYLDSISVFCRKNEITLLYFQSPLREGVYTRLDVGKATALSAHLKYVEYILSKDQNIFVDGNKVLWSDSLFLDGSHLNAKGAEAFTTYSFNQAYNQNSR